MANAGIIRQTGKQAGEVVLNDAIFGIEPNQAVVFDDVIISQRASLRQNSQLKTVQPFQVDANHNVKKELDVLVGFYPLSQWRGGGIVFGPTPQPAMKYKLPQKKFVALHLICLLRKKVTLKTNL